MIVTIIHSEAHPIDVHIMPSDTVETLMKKIINDSFIFENAGNNQLYHYGNEMLEHLLVKDYNV